MSLPAELAPFYRDAPRVDSPRGSFRGWLDTLDAVNFDGIVSGAPALRYPASVTLTRGDALTIDGVRYTVAQPPRRIGDGAECLVELQ